MTTTYSADEMSAMLQAGAAQIGRPTTRAAVHLLTFTALPGVRGFIRSVDIQPIEGEPVAGMGAFVRDWKVLAPFAEATRMCGGDQRLVTLAVGLAAGWPIDLRTNVSGGGTAYSRRIIEAFVIATGMDAFYEVTDLPALAKMKADHAAMLAGWSV